MIRNDVVLIALPGTAGVLSNVQSSTTGATTSGAFTDIEIGSVAVAPEAAWLGAADVAAREHPAIQTIAPIAPTPTAESTNTRRLEKWVGMATYRKGTDHRRANDART
jgi:hypothetical protein